MCFAFCDLIVRPSVYPETASDTDQECQLSALQHQLDEAKKRHAMMKKARQKYEFQKRQDAYKKQIEVRSGITSSIYLTCINLNCIPMCSPLLTCSAI